MTDGERRLEEMTEAECTALLTEHHVGRIGVVMTDGQPLILPVNYVYDGRRIAVRSDPGTKLASAAMARVALEIDGIDQEGRTGWSVLVQGRGFEITEALDEISELMRALPVDPWAPGDKACWIRIDPFQITGRRLL